MRLILILLLLCSQAQAKELVVFAASSLTDVLAKIGPEFERSHHVKIKYSFDASSRLARQIEQGARPDIYLAADKAWSDYLMSKGHVLKDHSQNLLSNELYLISHKSRHYTLESLKDLPNLKFKHLALAQENVPAGKYALESLKKEGIYEAVKAKIISADNVRNTLAWVIKDEADLGIVFSTDANASTDVKKILMIPPELHSKIVYTISLVGDHPTTLAQKFYQFLLGKKSQKRFIDFGFSPLEK